jgi:hypothetical protein
VGLEGQCDPAGSQGKRPVGERDQEAGSHQRLGDPVTTACMFSGKLTIGRAFNDLLAHEKLRLVINGGDQAIQLADRRGEHPLIARLRQVPREELDAILALVS